MHHEIYISAVIVLLACLIRRRRYRRRFLQEKEISTNLSDLSDYEIAYLSSGPERAVDLAIVKLVEQGNLRLTSNKRNHFYVNRKRLMNMNIHGETLDRFPTDKVELSIHECRRRIKPLIKSVKLSLITKGLHISVGEEEFWRNIVYLLGFVGVLLGFFFRLPVTMFSILVSCPLIGGPPRSRLIENLLSELRTLYSTDVSRNFALMGARSLSGGMMDELKSMLLGNRHESEGGCGCGC